jgi:hypothetical protein
MMEINLTAADLNDEAKFHDNINSLQEGGVAFEGLPQAEIDRHVALFTDNHKDAATVLSDLLGLNRVYKVLGGHEKLATLRRGFNEMLAIALSPNLGKCQAAIEAIDRLGVLPQLKTGLGNDLKEHVEGKQVITREMINQMEAQVMIDHSIRHSIHAFFDIWREFNEAERADLLKGITGSRAVPSDGRLERPIKFVPVYEQNSLVTHTCFNQVDISQWCEGDHRQYGQEGCSDETKDRLKERMRHLMRGDQMEG